MLGFSFNSHYCGEYGIIMRSKKRPILSATDDNYVQVPCRDGSVLFPGALKDKTITLECAIVAASLEAKRTLSRQIAAWLHTDDRAILSFDDEPNLYYRAKLTGEIDPEELYRMSTFDLTFNAGPLAYGPEQSGAMGTITNPGTYKSWPVYAAMFAAAASEWQVTNQDGYYVRVEHDFVAGDALEVNASTSAILINGARAMNKLDWQNSQFFSLRPGENTLTATPAGITAVSWIPCYL